MGCLIMTYLRKRAGIALTPHQVRYLSAKVVLDANPGEYETVQFIGHNSIKTTVGAYAGTDSRGAARRHQYLVEMPARRSKSAHSARESMGIGNDQTPNRLSA